MNGSELNIWVLARSSQVVLSSSSSITEFFIDLLSSQLIVPTILTLLQEINSKYPEAISWIPVTDDNSYMENALEYQSSISSFAFMIFTLIFNEYKKAGDIYLHMNHKKFY